MTHLFWYRTRVSSSFWVMKRNVLLVYQIIALRLKNQVSWMSQMTSIQVLLLLPSSLNLYPIKHGHCHGVFILKPSWVKGYQNWLLTSANIIKKTLKAYSFVSVIFPGRSDEASTIAVVTSLEPIYPITQSQPIGRGFIALQSFCRLSMFCLQFDTCLLIKKILPRGEEVKSFQQNLWCLIIIPQIKRYNPCKRLC